ncbi:SDR family NAD(P)-dependent oxidoreductase [Dactylosporangium darangshiense]|uniref:SDR family NAD(P)-dependent oxidoreductase n=1 Tax=Dactylosporangium darangshiense TaxID=579108 RepID=UPI003642D3AB
MTRTVVITGASAGIGLAAARRFASDRLILLGRDERRLAAAGALFPGSTTIRADFADLSQVCSAAARIAGLCDRVDVLVNNAGGLYRGPRAIAVNHLAGFLLANLLLDLLPGARIITTASLAEAWSVLDVDNPLRASLAHRSRWLSYGSSKQANLLFTLEAARRWSSSASCRLRSSPAWCAAVSPRRARCSCSASWSRSCSRPLRGPPTRCAGWPTPRAPSWYRAATTSAAPSSPPHPARPARRARLDFGSRRSQPLRIDGCLITVSASGLNETFK